MNPQWSTNERWLMDDSSDTTTLRLPFISGIASRLDTTHAAYACLLLDY